LYPRRIFTDVALHEGAEDSAVLTLYADPNECTGVGSQDEKEDFCMLYVEWSFIA
jgi:hypothetical protein